MTGQRDGDSMTLVVPGWLKTVVAGFGLAAAGWAWNMNAVQREMASDMRALKEMTAERFAALKERMDRVEAHTKQ